MILTPEMEQAVDIIANSNYNLYITGKAGTGKTTFLKYIIKNIKKKFVVAAPTGIAAINAGGVTLHSLFTIPFGVLDPRKEPTGLNMNKRELLKVIDALIIDEISMVRPDVLDYIDAKLRIYRERDEPFGGLQLIMFGDLYQLPPVVVSGEKEILLRFYKNTYFFNACVWDETGFTVIELNTIFRQSDPEFINMLNNIREYKVTNEDIELLSSLRSKRESQDYDSQAIHICTHKNDVTEINSRMLGTPERTYIARISGEFNENSAPCELTLPLRVGARVMTLVNSPTGGYYNGSLGVVTKLEDDKVTVRLDTKQTVVITENKWSCCEYRLENDEVKQEEKGSLTQIPLALAWAITIHKSQGMTFDKIVIHSKSCFCSGQMYVALSRCRTLEGVVTESFITKRDIVTNRALAHFEKQYKSNNNHFGEDESKEN